MKQLNIQDRKLNLIEQLIVLNDEEVFKQVEELVHSSFQKPQFKRFTKQELENRAKILDANIAIGEVEKLSQKTKD